VFTYSRKCRRKIMRRIILLLLPWVLVFAAEIAFAQKQHVPNSQVLAEIQHKLYHPRVLQHGDVQVTFEDGVATLTGAVDSIGVKEDAENAARKVGMWCRWSTRSPCTPRT
jgi:hypothetical protein